MYDIDGRIADLREQLRTLERSREILQRLDHHNSPRTRPPSITASEIRDFVWQKLIRPAKANGETRVAVRCGDVHRDMGLRDRLPSVVSALEAHRFEAQYGLRLAASSGPKAGSNRVLEFDVSPGRDQSLAQTNDERESEARPADLVTA